MGPEHDYFLNLFATDLNRFKAMTLEGCVPIQPYRKVFGYRRERVGLKVRLKINFMQLGPTFQVDDERELPRGLEKAETLFEFRQSEEGGRFFQNISHYRLLRIDHLGDFTGNESYHVLNVFQICERLKIEGVFTNEARTLIASLMTLL